MNFWITRSNGQIGHSSDHPELMPEPDLLVDLDEHGIHAAPFPRHTRVLTADGYFEFARFGAVVSRSTKRMLYVGVTPSEVVHTIDPDRVRKTWKGE